MFIVKHKHVFIAPLFVFEEDTHIEEVFSSSEVSKLGNIHEWNLLSNENDDRVTQESQG